MSDYSKTTNFASKDALLSGNPSKVVNGTELNTEFDNISTAVATKIEGASPTFTGTVTTATLATTVDDANNAAVITPFTLTHTTSGTPGAGIGVGLDFVAETASANNELGASIRAVTTDVGAGTEDFDLVVNLMKAGAAASEALRVSSTGVVTTTGSVVSDTDSTDDLGTTGVRWANAYVDDVTVTTNIVVGGTVDGRDVATDGTKLDTIETSATADQTDAQIKTAYENNADTNEFSDAEQTKLGTVETSADVTDATNVNAAGAVMNTDATTAAMSFVVDEDAMGSDSATKVPTQQSTKAYVDSQLIAANGLAGALLVGASTGGTDIVVTAADKITTDTIAETTAAAGVTVDGLLIKDGVIGNAAVTGLGTAALVNTGITTGLVPLVGTKSASLTLAGLVEQSTSAENVTGTDDTVFPSVAGTKEMIDTHVSVTQGTLTKTFAIDEASTISLTSTVTTPVVSVTKEVAQTGVTNNTWDVSSTTENYTRLDSAAATTLTPSATGDGTFTLGTGSFAAADVGKTITGNGGVAVLTTTGGAYVTSTAFTDTSAIASGSWSMYGVVYNTVDGDLELSSVAVSAAFDVSTSVYSQSFSVSGQDTAPYGLAFNTDGTKMFVVGSAGQDVNEYTLSTGFDVSTSTFVDAFSVAGQDTTPIGLAFNTDGTKMFVVGQVGDDVNEYTLSTGFDVSTSTFVDSFSVAGQDTVPRGLAFNTDGTKMFVVGGVGVDINEYTLSVGFDVSTASFVDAFSVSAQEASPIDVSFNTDGTKMFVVGYSGDDVNEYALSTGFDVSTSSFVDSFSVAGQDTAPVGLTFNTDGTKMFVVGLVGVDINEYTLTVGSTFITSGFNPVHTTASTNTTYWTDINSMTADQAAGDGNVYYAISTDDRTSWSVVDDTSGVRDIVKNNAGTWQYNSNGTYASETWTAGATNTELATLAEAMEGASSVIGQFDISTAAFVDSFSVSAQSAVPADVAFNTDGTKMFICGQSTNAIYEYALTTGFDVSTSTYSQSFSIGGQETEAHGLAFNPSGTKMFVCGNTGQDVNEYTLSTGFDVSTASFVDSFSVASQDTSPQGIAFNSDGTKMFIAGNTGRDINEYTLSTGYDVSTSSFVDSFSVSAQTLYVPAVIFNSDGTQMFVMGSTNTIYKYTLTTGFDVSTASYSAVSFSFNAQEISGSGFAFNSDGTKMFITGYNGDDVNEYTVGTTSYTNQMDKTQLDAVTDPNQVTLGTDLDLSIILNLTSGTTVPSSDGVAINYDANVLNKGAILGTDYDFDAPATNKVRITALAANNLKVRVV